MEVINPFIKKNKPRMIKFLDELSVSRLPTLNRPPKGLFMYHWIEMF